MKKPFLAVVLLMLFLVACKDKSENKERKKILPSSTGTINSLSVIINDDVWRGPIGETIREEFTKPVTGLPQEEPIFSLSHIPTAAFEGFTKTSRIFIKVDAAEEPYFQMVKDTFATPQVAVFVGGKNAKDIQSLIKENSGKIIRNFKRTEIAANQARIAKSLKETEPLEKKFGLTLKFPSAYRYAKEEEGFVWIRKDIPQGSMEILIYEVPLSEIDKDTNTVTNIVKVRDSIGKKYIPGPTEDSYMITEKVFTPSLYKTEIDGKFTWLTKGTWELEGAFMAGPFVNYAVKDEKNNRYLVMEGFVFKPQAPTKRNNIFELQAIFNSAVIR